MVVEGYANINLPPENTEGKEKRGLVDKLKQYGLDGIKSFSEQFGQIGKKTRSLFDGALNIFKKKSSQETRSERDSYAEVVQRNVKNADRIVCGFRTDNEQELYDYVRKILKDIVSVSEDELTKKSFDIIGAFKNEVIDSLQKRSMSADEARRFVEDRLLGNSDVKDFLLIETGEKLKLVSIDFISKIDEYQRDWTLADFFGRVDEATKMRPEELAKESLVEQLISAVELASGGRVDRVDWRQVKEMLASEALRMLKQISIRLIEGKKFSGETKQWIKDSINNFEPHPDETFAEYVERRFMQTEKLSILYNNIVEAVKASNAIEHAIDISKPLIKRKMIGEMPVERIIDVVKKLSVKKKIGIRSAKIRPVENESLRSYFYRLTAYSKGYLREDGTVDEKKLRNDSDFKNMVQLLINIVPPMSRRKLLGGVEEDIGYYKYYNRDGLN